MADCVRQRELDIDKMLHLKKARLHRRREADRGKTLRLKMNEKLGFASKER